MVSVPIDSRRRFRERARAWLTLAEPSRSSPIRMLDIPEFGDRVAVAGAAGFDDHSVFDDGPLLVAGDFHCGAGCRFPEAVYAGGRAEVGRGSQLRAIIAEGAVTLAPGAQIQLWVESGGDLDIRSRCRVGGEAVSSTAIQLGTEASAGSLFAPHVATHSHGDGFGDPAPVSSYLEIDKPSSGREPDLRIVRGWRPEKLRSLGDETWLYDGPLHLPMPLLLRAKLIVRGSLYCPPGSLLEDDVKAGGSIEIGAASLCRGNVTSHADLTLDAGCMFGGELRAAGTLRLASGTRGFREGVPVLVSAGGAVLLEPDVVVRGRLLSESASVEVGQAESAGLDGLLAEA